MSTARHFITNVAAQGTARALSISANLVTFIVIARTLGADVFGQFVFLMAFVGIACNAADLGTTSVLARGLAQTGSDDSRVYFGNFLLLRSALAIIVTALAVAGAFMADPSLVHELLVCAIAVPFVASRFFDPVYQVFERPWYTVYASLIYSVVQLVMAVVILLWLRLPLLYYLYGYAATNLIYVIVAFLLTKPLIRPVYSVNWPLVRNIMVIAAPVGVASFFTIINRRADIVMLNAMRSSYEVGIYSAAYKLLDFAAILAVTFTTPLIPILSRKLALGRDKLKPVCMQIMELVAIVIIPAAIIVSYIAEPLILLLFGAEYVESAGILGIFAWVFVLIVFALIGSTINLAMGVVAHGYWNALLAAGINIALNLLWIPEYGYQGAVWATLISNFSLLAVSQYYVARNMGFLINYRRWLVILSANMVLYLVLLQLVEGGLGILLAPVLLALYFLVLYKLGFLAVPQIRAQQDQA